MRFFAWINFRDFQGAEYLLSTFYGTFELSKVAETDIQ